MLDIRFVENNLDMICRNTHDRFIAADPRKVVALYQEWKHVLQKVENLRQQKKENAQKSKQKLDDAIRLHLIEDGKKLKETLLLYEKQLRILKEQWKQALALLPNLTAAGVPHGNRDEDNREIHQVGSPRIFSFPVCDHVEIGTRLDLLDFERAAVVSGAKFYYLKNEAVLLELALYQYAFNTLVQKGFTPYMTPDMARSSVVEGLGFAPRGNESNMYMLDDMDLCLIGTSEITLGGYYQNKQLTKSDLPIRMVGLSHCFRREAGAAGQFSKGLYRVHQFAKVEMFVLCHPDDSAAMHQELLAIECDIFSELGIPFRVLDICMGDLGMPAYRKYDLEAWIPSRGENGEWGEVTSASNCTDYQARRLNIRFKDGDTKGFVHTLNGTAIATSRALLTILENYQNEDGSVAIPHVLQKYTGFSSINIKKNIPIQS